MDRDGLVQNYETSMVATFKNISGIVHERWMSDTHQICPPNAPFFLYTVEQDHLVGMYAVTLSQASFTRRRITYKRMLLSVYFTRLHEVVTAEPTPTEAIQRHVMK